MSSSVKTAAIRISASAALCAGATGVAAMAQPVADRLEIEPIASLTVVFAPGGRDRAGEIPASEVALGELELGGRAEYILDNGAEIGGRLVWRAQRDHPNRPGGSGNPLSLPVNDRGDGLVGAFSGVSSGGVSGDVGARGALESAFVYLRGGYGEISVGRDTGVAARFQEGDVDVFSLARVSDTGLDTSGLNTVYTRANLTGPAEKLSYTSPRILGLRAGMSFTPIAERAGLDRNPVFGADGLVRPEIQNAAEAGLSFSRRFRESGLRVRAGLGYVTAELEQRADAAESASDRTETVSAGMEIERGDVRFGGSWLRSDDGFDSGEYTAISVGAAYTWNDWTASATLARSESDVQGVETDVTSIGVSRPAGPIGTLTVGYQDIETRSEANPAQTKGNRGGIVIELSLSL